MEVSRKSCRICISETEFNISLFGDYCRRTKMLDKIIVCLKLVIEETDTLITICYKCTENIERYYDFITFVKKSQTKLAQPRQLDSSFNRCKMTSIHVNKQVVDADLTLSFFELPEDEVQQKTFTPMFPYFSPPSKVMKKASKPIWKTPRAVENREKHSSQRKEPQRPRPTRQRSRDIFESQSQEADNLNPKSQDWKLTAGDNNNILKRLRDTCFGWSDF